MLRQGIVPNAFTFGALISICEKGIRKGQKAMAKGWRILALLQAIVDLLHAILALLQTILALLQAILSFLQICDPLRVGRQSLSNLSSYDYI